jgi:hypothetical protein
MRLYHDGLGETPPDLKNAVVVVDRSDPYPAVAPVGTVNWRRNALPHLGPKAQHVWLRYRIYRGQCEHELSFCSLERGSVKRTSPSPHIIVVCIGCHN